MKTVDLRSDTVTQPTAAMREAMMAAPLGDDVFGDDPSVNALQDHIAAITGKEAALFMASGTQSNLCGILAHCGRGDEYIVGQLAHTYRYEGGGAAVFGSVQPQPLAQDAVGQMALADIAAAIKPNDPHFAQTRLLCLENTWNGQPMPDSYLAAATQLARATQGRTHRCTQALAETHRQAVEMVSDLAHAGVNRLTRRGGVRQRAAAAAGAGRHRSHATGRHCRRHQAR